MKLLLVKHIGRPTPDAPLGDEFIDTFERARAYSFDAEDHTLLVVDKDGKRVTYPESRVIRVIEVPTPLP